MTYLSDPKVCEAGALEPLPEIMLGHTGLCLEDGQGDSSLCDRRTLRLLGDHIVTVQTGILYHLVSQKLQQTNVIKNQIIG